MFVRLYAAPLVFLANSHITHLCEVMSGVNIELSGTKKEMAHQSKKFEEKKALYITSLGSQTQDVRQIIMRFNHVRVTLYNYKFMCFQRLELIDKLEKLMASDEKKDTVRKELQAELEELADSIKTLYKKEKDRLEDTVYQLQLELSVSEIINFFNSIALI